MYLYEIGNSGPEGIDEIVLLVHEQFFTGQEWEAMVQEAYDALLPPLLKHHEQDPKYDCELWHDEVSASHIGNWLRDQKGFVPADTKRSHWIEWGNQNTFWAKHQEKIDRWNAIAKQREAINLQKFQEEHGKLPPPVVT